MAETDWLVKMPIVHRGFYLKDGIYPENSIEAFERAASRNFAIELDVQLLADEKIIVFHDDNLKRMTGFDKPVEQCNLQEIKQLGLLGSSIKIPLLYEVFETINGKVPLLIEIKNKKKPGVLEKKLFQAISQYNGRYAIQSFNPFSVQWFLINAPHILRGQLSGKFKKSDNLTFFQRFILQYLLVNFVSKPSFINYNIKYLPNLIVKWLRRNGIPILGWTASSIEEYHEALKWCDNVLFENFDPLEGKNEL